MVGMPEESNTLGFPQRAANASAEQDRTWLRLAIETANLFTWHMDPVTHDISSSANANAVLGFPLETNPDDVRALVHPDDREDVTRRFERAIQGEEKLEAEFRFIRPGVGDEVWVNAQGIMVEHGEDNGARLVGVTQNITDRKRRELNVVFLAELAEELTRLSSPDDILRAAGEKVKRYFGVSRLAFVTVNEAANQVTAVYESYEPDLVGGLGTQRLSDYVSEDDLLEFKQGRPVAVGDVSMDPRTASRADAYRAFRIQAQLMAPHVSNGSLDFIVAMQHATPYRWRGDEIELAREIAARVHSRVERAWADVALRQSEDQYRALLESIDQGFSLVDVLFDEDGDAVDYRFLEVNAAFERHTGLHDAAGKRMTELAPDHEAHWFETYGRVATTGESVRFTNEARSLGGRWFDVNAFRVGGPESRKVAILFTDVTEARRAEIAVRKSEERLRRAIEIDSVGVVYFRTDGTITFANEAFLRMSGYTHEDVENGRVRWDKMTPPEWMADTRRALDEFTTLGRISPYEKEYIRKNGSRWWALFAGTRLDDGEGVKFVIDITANKRAVAERERLAAIVEYSRDAVIGIDLDGTVTDWNKAAEDLYGYTAKEIVERDAALLVPTDRAEESIEHLRRLKRGEDIPSFDTERLRKDGSLVEVEVQLSPIRDPGNHVVGAAVIVRDATARKRLERAQDDFLAMASHDLRSPVTVINGQVQLMKRRKAYDEERVDVILEQTRRVERLIGDLQQVVQLESGGIELQRVSVDLGELAQDAAERSGTQSPRHTVRADVPGEPVVGTWDRDRIAQVLDNLLGNAVKYSPDESEITVGVTIIDREARLSVTDQGEGIPHEKLSQLFERFYRADHGGTTSGLGLGLYIARMLTEAHGGRIWAETEPGKGSSFIVALPMEP